jgi:hypothetical protein
MSSGYGFVYIRVFIQSNGDTFEKDEGILLHSGNMENLAPLPRKGKFVSLPCSYNEKEDETYMPIAF